jgi:hypothetical protein
MVASAAVADVPISVREPEERRIAWTTAVSVLLHALLLFAIGFASVPSTDSSAVPELTFDLSLEDGRDPEEESSPSTERSAAPTTMVADASPAAIADNQPSDFDPPPVVTSADPAPAPNEALAEASLADFSVPSEMPGITNSEILATSGVSDIEVPIDVEAPPPPEPVLEAIPTAEQAVLTRKILEGVQGLQDTELKETQLAWQQDGREYTAVLTHQPAADNTGIDRMMVEIVTQERGKRLQTRMQMKRLAFSHFTQLVDRWDQDVQLHDDEIVGRFHSNSEIFVGYDRTVAPRFLGKVTTAARGFTISSSGGRKQRSEIFQAGVQTRAGRITLPTKFLPFAPSSSHQKVEVQSYTGDTRLTFYSDGTYGWAPARSKEPEQRQALSNATTYIVGARDSTLYVRGTVSGKVLVYSPDLIVIEGHLVYANDPRSSAESPDYLGLVSDNYIEVARPGITGPGDLEIDAAIFAKRRFVVTEEYARGGGTLFIYGSLTAGSISATEPRYATKISFDPRFEEARPPGFPVTDRYEVEGWDAQWKVAEMEP